MSTRVVVIAGPTASGKSSLAVQLSLKLGAHVLNADSRQVYRELNAGVAKPTAEELAAVPHHLVGHVSIHDPYSAGRWAAEARQLLAGGRADAPGVAGATWWVISGGSGLHVRALVDGIPDMPQVPSETRERWTHVLAKAGLPALQAALRERDPEYAAVVDLANPHRLLRALSVMEASGETFTALRARPASPLPYRVQWLVIDPDRTLLYQRINARVERMLAGGLEEEARTLLPYRDLDALQTIGYREWWPYFDGTSSREEVVAAIKQSTRHYARRQLTWNRKLSGARLAEPDADAALSALKLTA